MGEFSRHRHRGGEEIEDVLDAGTVAQPRGSGTGLEALLPSQCHLVFKQEAKPFGMFEGASLCNLFEFLEALSHTVEAEVV